MINNQLQPAGFNVSLLKPILKSDSKPNDDFSNTRLVAISDAIQNLFERVMLWRLNQKHKDHGHQFGFKPNSSCSHAVFVVSQAANFAKQNNERLYTCAVDASPPHMYRVMSPKLFSIFVEEMINEVEASGCDIRIGKVRFGAIMYADDLLLLATSKEETNIQLKFSA